MNPTEIIQHLSQKASGFYFRLSLRQKQHTKLTLEAISDA